MLKKVISGGQTGVDRAGLDAAMAAGIPAEGYCPRGRLAEDGAIPDIYPLRELGSPEYHVRTEKNVAESDGTLILNKGPLSEGTRLTYEYAVHYLKPFLVVQLDEEPGIEPAAVFGWLASREISILNVAGPRESKFRDGIYRQARSFLEKLFLLLKESPNP